MNQKLHLEQIDAIAQMIALVLEHVVDGNGVNSKIQEVILLVVLIGTINVGSMNHSIH